MRKRSAYRQRPISTPIMVERSLCETDVELAERMLIESFASGWATTKHYDGLANMRNVLTVAAAYKDAQDVLHICGEESGYVVGLINYPRFPSTPADIEERARDLMHKLLDATFQHSGLLMTPVTTEWVSKRDCSK